MHMSKMSTVSESDLALFNSLANPNNTLVAKKEDMEDVSIPRGSPPQSIVSGHSAMGYSVPPIRDNSPETSANGWETSHIDDYGTSERHDQQTDDVPSPRSERSCHSHGSQRSTVSNFATRVQENISETSLPLARGGVLDYNVFDRFGTRPTAAPHNEDANDYIDKQQALLELERMKNNKGIRMSKRYTLNDKLEDIEFELKRHQLHIEEETTVTFMKDTLRLCFGGIEMANHKLGPWLDLDGWASSCSEQLDKWDPALSRIYRKYCKKRTMSPESEIVLGIVSSMGMHHCRKTFSKSLTSDIGFSNRGGPNKRTSITEDLQDDADEGLPPQNGI